MTVGHGRPGPTGLKINLQFTNVLVTHDLLSFGRAPGVSGFSGVATGGTEVIAGGLGELGLLVIWTKVENLIEFVLVLLGVERNDTTLIEVINDASAVGLRETGLVAICELVKL